MSIHRKYLSTTRSRQRVGAGLVASALVASLPLGAITASAAVNPVPVLPHSITSFPARDFVSAEGYTPGAAVTVNVLRGGFVVGTSKAFANSTGMVEVNHPQTAPDITNCWNDVTPDIQAADVIEVLTAPLTGDSTTTADVVVTSKATESPAGAVVIKGTAVAPGGGQLPLDELESRIISGGENFSNGSNKLLADSTGTSDGSLDYDDATASTWTATFSGLAAADKAEALAGESRILWLGAGALGTGITIFEVGANPADVVNGPADPCTAPAANGPSQPDMTATTDTNVTTDNITSNTRPTFIGSAGDAGTTPATGVNVYVDGLLSGPAVVSAGRYSFTPTTPLTGGAHQIEARATAAGAPDTKSPRLLVTIDTLRPTVLTRTPAPNAIKVVQAGNLTAKFSERVVGVGSTTFTLRKWVGNALVPATVTYSSTGNLATLNPTATLLAGTKYLATVTNGIKDVAGNPILTSSWSFTTGPKPVVTAKSPAAGAVGVKRLANATATFSEHVIGAPTAFTLKKTSTGALVGATVTYNATTRVVTLNPRVTLSANTRYTAVLSGRVWDADSNTLTPISWTFTTGAS